MPVTPKRPCAHAGCPALVEYGKCDEHRKQAEQRRGSAHERGYGKRWQAARAGWLREHPLCAEHERQGLIAAGNEVDHIIPHRGDMTLFWQRSNWQTLCKACHSSKTAREDGGFGHTSSAAP